MPKQGDLIKIPLKTKDAIAGIFKVKPTAEMPKPGTAKKSKKRKKR